MCFQDSHNSRGLAKDITSAEEVVAHISIAGNFEPETLLEEENPGLA